MKSPILWFGLNLLAIIVVTALGPAEKSLGTNVRVVYLHGAWVWAALICIFAAAAVGLVGLITRRNAAHYWSLALGRTGLVFWITYLPLSLWAMQTNWNGLFLSEPRWRVAMIFAIGGLILQIGITLLENPAWASALNLVYVVILVYVLQTTDQVMHPGSPIFGSGAWRIQIYFLLLLVLTLLAAWQLARLWYGINNPSRVQATSVE
ncbi:MAG: hypothetical protein MUO57_04180 [Anaerolineales bacterium]|nr:hypothetical protein [Anaerolineales bacterium]